MPLPSTRLPLARRRRRASATVAALLLAFAAAARGAGGERVIVCLGDSLTEGYGLAPDRAYPSLVERMLSERGRAVRVINAGISGSTSASAVSRLRWQLRSRPDIVLIALGANDGLRGVDVAATRANLSAAIDLAQQNGARVLLAGMKLPPNYGPKYTTAFAAMFPALAAQHRVALLPFLLEGVAGDPALNQPDGIHPNERGTEIVARNVLEALLPLLDEKQKASGSSARSEAKPSEDRTASGSSARSEAKPSEDRTASGSSARSEAKPSEDRTGLEPRR
jgi:acyl-CoA thioesterase-1